MYQQTTKKILVIPSITIPLLALAVTSVNVAAQDSERRTLEEIVITAQKREQNLQDVPISASAFSAQDIKDKNITNVSDLQYLSPALSVQEQGNLKFVNIRGVGIATVSPQTTSGVAYHADGFFIPNEIALSETYFDLAGIEILRGPQGTYVGQNSTGGAMFINTAKPSYGESGYSLSANAGSYGYQKLEGAVDIPASDNFAIRVAGYFEKKDSFYDNIGPGGEELNKIDRQGLRASFLYSPTDTLEISFKQEITSGDSGGVFQKDLTDGILDNETVALDALSKLEMDVERSVLEVNWELSDTLLLRSTTGYQTVNQDLAEDTDNTIVNTTWRTLEIDETTYSQEFNLISSLGGSFEYVLGAFLLNDKSYFHSVDYTAPGARPQSWTVFDGKPAHESWSIFGEGTWQLSDDIELIAGMRYIDDTVLDDDGGWSCIACNEIAGLTGGPENGRQPISNSKNTTEQTGRVVINWQLDDNHMVYGSLAKGFKSGGFNPGRQDFKPEYVVSTEIGHKATVLDGQLRINTSAYHYDYEGYQLRVYDPLLIISRGRQGTSLLNTIDTKIWGLESEVLGVFGNLTGSFSVGYGKSDLGALTLFDDRDRPARQAPIPGTEIDVSGRALSFHPELTYSLGIQYTFELNNGTLIPSLQYSATDDQWAQIFQKDVDYIDSHDILGMSLTFESDSNWRLKAYVTNLSDDSFVTGKRINRARKDVEYYGSPRQYGIEFGWSTF